MKKFLLSCVFMIPLLSFTGEESLLSRLKYMLLERKGGSVRLDGIYSRIDTTKDYCGQSPMERYYADGILVFFGNGVVIYIKQGFSSLTDTRNFLLKAGSPVDAFLRWGTYNVNNGKLDFIVPIPLVKRGMVYKSYLARFTANVDDKGDIVGLRMTSPFPAANPKLNNGFTSDVNPKNMIFKPFPDKTLVDSVSILSSLIQYYR